MPESNLFLDYKIKIGSASESIYVHVCSFTVKIKTERVAHYGE